MREEEEEEGRRGRWSPSSSSLRYSSGAWFRIGERERESELLNWWERGGRREKGVLPSIVCSFPSFFFSSFSIINNLV